MESNTPSNNFEGTLKKRPLPSFVKKLWFILADVPSHEHIFWVDNGQVICVPNASSFSKVILPRFFKHSNWQSFVRQLNLYGFRKVYQLNLSYDESTDKRTVWQFKHECFRKDQPEKLCEIKRRASKSNQQQQQNGPSSSSSSSLQQQQQQQNNTAYNLNNNNNNNNNNNTNYTNQQQHTEFGLNGESIEQTLQRFTDRLEQADKKRRELWEQTVKLSQIQARQQKAIRVLTEFIMQFLENHADSENDRIRFNNIMQKLMEQDNIEDLLPFDDNSIMSSGGDEIDGEEHEDEEDMDVEEDEDDEMKAYTIIPPQQQSLPTSNIYSTASSASQLPLQSQQHQLPSISSLMTDHSSHILPPLRKRPNNNN